MKRFFRIIAASLAILMLLSSFVSASVFDKKSYYNEYTPYRAVISRYDELMEHLYQMVVDGEFYVNLKSFGLKEEYLVPVFTDLVSASPELFFLNSKLSYRYIVKNDEHYVTAIYFDYNMQGQDLWKAQKTFADEVAYIASLVDPALTDAEKALWVHDYMVSLYCYDSDLVVYDAYRIMTGETGVCRAYSLAYSAVLQEMGIECIMVVSNEMNHAWNLVNLDGQWYHVDLVYDDPGMDKPGKVSHEYFLLSDEEISEREVGAHYNWATTLVCDKSYSGAMPWKGIPTQLTYLDGKWYYIDSAGTSVVGVDLATGEKTTAYTFTNRWYTTSERRNKWVGVFSGLASYNGMLVVNTDRQVVAIDPKTSETYVLYETGVDSQLCGVTVHKDELKLFVSFAPQGDENTRIERAKITEIKKEAEQELPTEEITLPFDDVAVNDKYYDSIAYTYYAGLFNGVSATKFSPNSTLTRAMFVTVLGRLCGVDVSGYTETMFSDVPTGEWYSPYVTWAAQEGIVNGVGNGKFDPMGELTREQMYKITAYCATILTGYDTATIGVLPYADSDSISSWAYDSVKYCAKWGLIDRHNGNLNPSAKATRAEAADIIARLSKIINK